MIGSFLPELCPFVNLVKFCGSNSSSCYLMVMASFRINNPIIAMFIWWGIFCLRPFIWENKTWYFDLIFHMKWQRIHLKHQALFSSKDKSKIKIKVLSAAILLGPLRVKILIGGSTVNWWHLLLKILLFSIMAFVIGEPPLLLKILFLLACTKEQNAVVMTLTSIWAWALASNFSF